MDLAEELESVSEHRPGEESVHQLSLALEQSPVLVVITDLQGRMIYVNRKFSEVTEYSFDECIGRTPRILKSGESSPSIYQELWTCITGGNTWRGEFHNRKKNGELYWERLAGPATRGLAATPGRSLGLPR